MLHQFSLSLVPILPMWFIAALATALLLLLAQGSVLLLRKKVPRNWVALLGILRVAVVVVLVLGLLQPVVSFSKTTDRLPDLMILVDTSQSMGSRTTPTGPTRLEQTMASLRSGGLANDLDKHFDIHWFNFDRSAYPVEATDLPGLKPTGDSTRFADSLNAAWNYQRQSDPSGPSLASGPPPHAMIVSDGDDLGADDVVEAARKLGVIVDTLPPNKSSVNQSANRVVLAAVQSPRRVLLGSETRILATLHADGAVTDPVTLNLVENGKPLASQEVTFAPGKSEQQVRLIYRPGEVGLRQYELRLRGGVTTTADAPYKLSIRVVDKTKEVLILEDTWRWEFKYFRHILEDDPSFSFTAFLARGPMYAQFSEADRKVNLGGFPQGRDELEWFDVIVLGDVNPQRWPPNLARAINEMVTQEGKSLVVIAGPNVAKLAEVPEIGSLLPVEVTRETATPIEGPIDVQLSAEGASSPFFFNTSSKELPPLDRVYPPLRKRPAATILLEAATQANAYGNLIVTAEQTVGKGRVLYIGTDTLWKWQMTGPLNEAGVTPYAMFWQQALRALAPLQSYEGGVSLTLDPDRTRYETGQKVTLRAEIKSDRPLSSPSLESSVTLPNGKQAPLAFVLDPTNPNHYQAEFEPSAAGEYKITATVGVDGKTAADVLTSIDVEEPRAELSNTRIDVANLARIAAGTGGKLVDPADPSTWPTTGNTSSYEVQQVHHLDLWNNMTLLITLTLLLGGDWLLRLLRGFV